MMGEFPKTAMEAGLEITGWIWPEPSPAHEARPENQPAAVVILMEKGVAPYPANYFCHQQ